MSNYTFLVKNANSLDRQMIKVLKAAIKKKGCASIYSSARTELD